MSKKCISKALLDLLIEHDISTRVFNFPVLKISGNSVLKISGNLGDV